MYEHFEINLDDASFEWDDEKEKLNFNKHGITMPERLVIPAPSAHSDCARVHPSEIYRNSEGIVVFILELPQKCFLIPIN